MEKAQYMYFFKYCLSYFLSNIVEKRGHIYLFTNSKYKIQDIQILLRKLVNLVKPKPFFMCVVSKNSYVVSGRRN